MLSLDATSASYTADLNSACASLPRLSKTAPTNAVLHKAKVPSMPKVCNLCSTINQVGNSITSQTDQVLCTESLEIIVTTSVDSACGCHPLVLQFPFKELNGERSLMRGLFPVGIKKSFLFMRTCRNLSFASNYVLGED